MKNIYKDYEMYSYSVQKDICKLRRELDLPCRKCRYYDKCKNSNIIIDRLNRDLNIYKERFPH